MQLLQPGLESLAGKAVLVLKLGVSLLQSLHLHRGMERLKRMVLGLHAGLLEGRSCRFASVKLRILPDPEV